MNGLFFGSFSFANHFETKEDAKDNRYKLSENGTIGNVKKGWCSGRPALSGIFRVNDEERCPSPESMRARLWSRPPPRA